MTTEQFKAIAEDPRAFLNRNYRIEERIKMKQRRIEHLHNICISTTQEIKTVVAYTGPSDKVGNCVAEALDLEAEIRNDIAGLEQIQRETAEAIELLVSDVNMRTILESRYLAGMRWEEIAVSMSYAYRWVMRLHLKALDTMKSEAKARCQEIPD